MGPALGAVPFWIRFNMQPSFEDLQRYLHHADPYDEIYVNLFSQGLWSPGVVPVRHWRELAATNARVRARVIGVDEDTYPLDAGSTVRYPARLRRTPPTSAPRATGRRRRRPLPRHQQPFLSADLEPASSFA